MTNDAPLDLVIVGAGPAGLSAAYAAAQRSLSYLVLERGRIANTVEGYPLGKTLFSDESDVAIVPGTLRPAGERPTREEVLNYYRRFAEDEHALRIRTYESVTKIVPGSPLRVVTTQAEYATRCVLVATGVGDANRLGVPGETPERVSYLYQEIQLFRDRDVLVVGGGNSAGEAALDLLETGARVTLALRRPSFDRSGASRGAAIQPPVRVPLDRAVNTGRLRTLFNASVVEILDGSAVLQVDGETVEVPCERVFALLGTTPDTRLLAEAGVRIEPDGIPWYDASFETNVTNLYVIGHVTRSINLRNAVRLPPSVVDAIARRLAEQAVGTHAPAALDEPPSPLPTAEEVVRAPEAAEPAPPVTPPALAQPLDSAATAAVAVCVDVRDEAIVDLHLSPARVREALSALASRQGVLGVALAELTNGAVHAVAAADASCDVNCAAHTMAEILRGMRSTFVGAGDVPVEETVVTLDRHTLLAKALSADPEVFLYLAVDRTQMDLGLARYVLDRARHAIDILPVEPPIHTIVSPDVRRADRVPPGQSVTSKWPVMHFGPVRRVDAGSWRLRVFGLVEREWEGGLEEILAMPSVAVLADFHCVTRWSRLDNLWEGVAAREILSRVRPLRVAKFAIIHAEGGWSTNLPIEALEAEDTLFAYRHNGAQLEPEHGYPLRLVVPRLYAWKSAKWVRAVELAAENREGFWERAGYHMNGDPWREERRA